MRHPLKYLIQLLVLFAAPLAGCAPVELPGQTMAKEYVMRSFRRVAQGDFHGAIAEATKALQLDPKNDEAYFARGMGYEFLGQYDQAISDYNTVLEINPNHSYAVWHKAKSYEKTGRVREAEEALKAWCERSPAAKQHPFCR